MTFKRSARDRLVRLLRRTQGVVKSTPLGVALEKNFQRERIVTMQGSSYERTLELLKWKRRLWRRKLRS
jgi:hypothetical protein